MSAAKQAAKQAPKPAAKLAAAQDKRVTDAAFKEWNDKISKSPLFPPIFDITTAKGRADSQKYNDENGFVVLSCFTRESEVQAFCARVLPEMVAATMAGCHYNKERRDTVPLFTLKRERDDLMGEWKGSKTFKSMHKDLRDAWYPHCTFGAPSSALAFNCPVVHEARGWHCMWQWATDCFGGAFAFPTNDRMILKPTGSGEDCFLHIDMNAPWFRHPADAAGPPEYRQVLGKLALSHGQTFIAVPGSHLRHAEIAEAYREHYPHAAAKHPKWALHPMKADPLGLFDGARKVIVPRGCWISWNRLLFHGVAKNSRKQCAFGLYLGFTDSIERPEYERVTGVDEVTDRYNMWRYGDAPKAFPSCDLVHFLPYSFKNFPAGMLSYIKKCDADDPTLLFYNRQLATDATRFAAAVSEVRDPRYVPPYLSAIRRMKLVGKRNVGRFDFGDTGNFPVCKRARTK
jgi:hypothetical protein